MQEEREKRRKVMQNDGFLCAMALLLYTKINAFTLQ
jgi:hypothetical protein